MDSSQSKASLALAGVVAAAVGAGSQPAEAAKPDWEEGWVKCAGVVEAGKNDCGNANHNCAGQAKKDRLPDEWVYLPKGACDKLAGGKVIASSESGQDR